MARTPSKRTANVNSMMTMAVKGSPDTLVSSRNWPATCLNCSVTDKGRVISVAGRQYEALSLVAQYLPRPLVRRISGGRRSGSGSAGK